MPRKIQLDGVIHSFPDDATDAEISAALDSGPATPATPANPTLLSRVAGAPNTAKTLAASALAAGVGALRYPLEVLNYNQMPAEELASKVGRAGQIASTVAGLATGANELYKGHPIDAVHHAVEGAFGPLAVRALYKYVSEKPAALAGEVAADVPIGLQTIVGAGAKVASVAARAAKMIPGVNAISAEGDALARLNSPESLAGIAQSMTPDQRKDIVRRLPNSPIAKIVVDTAPEHERLTLQSLHAVATMKSGGR